MTNLKKKKLKKKVEIFKCEECGIINETVIQNFFIYGFKTCNSCNLSKKIFPY